MGRCWVLTMSSPHPPPPSSNSCMTPWNVRYRDTVITGPVMETPWDIRYWDTMVTGWWGHLEMRDTEIHWSPSDDDTVKCEIQRYNGHRLMKTPWDDETQWSPPGDDRSIISTCTCINQRPRCTPVNYSINDRVIHTALNKFYMWMSISKIALYTLHCHQPLLILVSRYFRSPEEYSPCTRHVLVT